MFKLFVNQKGHKFPSFSVRLHTNFQYFLTFDGRLITNENNQWSSSKMYRSEPQLLRTYPSRSGVTAGRVR